MSSFTQPLTVTKIGAHLWRVEREFEYHIGSEDNINKVKVPKGFKSDFASVPQAFWWIVPPDGLYTQACVLHDYTYFKKLFKRGRCDYIFYEAMGVLGVPNWKRSLMHWAVRCFAWLGWNAHRRRNKD